MPNTLDSLVRHVFQKIVVKMVEQLQIFSVDAYTYLIRDAIHDGNVLGFSVDYINTFKIKALKSRR